MGFLILDSITIIEDSRKRTPKSRNFHGARLLRDLRFPDHQQRGIGAIEVSFLTPLLVLGISKTKLTQAVANRSKFPPKRSHYSLIDSKIPKLTFNKYNLLFGGIYKLVILSKLEALSMTSLCSQMRVSKFYHRWIECRF